MSIRILGVLFAVALAGSAEAQHDTAGVERSQEAAALERRGETAVLEKSGETAALEKRHDAVRGRGDARSFPRAKGLTGTWFAPRKGFAAFIESQREWPLTEAGRKTRAEPASAGTGHEECLPLTAPAIMVYPIVRTIEIDDDMVVFDLDWSSSRRVVHMDGRGHPKNGQRTLQGDSVGHWEGNTLVVDTVQFADHPDGNAPGLPSGSRKHLVERFSLTQDARHINYKAALEDPDYLAKPVIFSSQWEYRPDLEPMGLKCELGAARRYLTDE